MNRLIHIVLKPRGWRCRAGLCPAAAPRRLLLLAKGGWTARAGAAAALLLAACSPTFNWREVRAPAASVAVLLPCKPESATRAVQLGGARAELAMLGCEAGDLTFALGALRLPASLGPQEAALALQQASAASVRAAPEAVQAWPATVARLPADAQVRGWLAQGQRPDGRPVRAQALQVLRGGELVQLAVYGPAGAEVLQTLWEGVRVDPAR